MIKIISNNKKLFKKSDDITAMLTTPASIAFPAKSIRSKTIGQRVIKYKRRQQSDRSFSCATASTSVISNQFFNCAFENTHTILVTHTLKKFFPFFLLHNFAIMKSQIISICLCALACLATATDYGHSGSSYPPDHGYAHHTISHYGKQR